MKTVEKRTPAQVSQTLSDYWDSHSLADVWDKTTPAHFEVADGGPTSRYVAGVDPELLLRVRRLAAARGLQTESMLNLLLEQRLHEITA